MFQKLPICRQEVVCERMPQYDCSRSSLSSRSCGVPLTDDGPSVTLFPIQPVLCILCHIPSINRHHLLSISVSSLSLPLIRHACCDSCDPSVVLQYQILCMHRHYCRLTRCSISRCMMSTAYFSPPVPHVDAVLPVCALLGQEVSCLYIISGRTEHAV